MSQRINCSLVDNFVHRVFQGFDSLINVEKFVQAEETDTEGQKASRLVNFPWDTSSDLHLLSKEALDHLHVVNALRAVVD